MNGIERTRRGSALAGVVAIALALAGFAAHPAPAHAQAALTQTTVAITAPADAQVGQEIALQARLTTASGAPVAKVAVSFASPATFLNVTGNAVVAEGITDANGVATATWRVTRSGALTIQAEFVGNTRYAASRATAKLSVTGDRQLYTQAAGVPIPGLNTSPGAGIRFLAALWPRASAWPIGAALLVVWSMYATVATLLYRIAAADTGAAVPNAQPVEAK